MMRRLSYVYRKIELHGLYAMYECSICRNIFEHRLPNNNKFCKDCEKKVKRRIKKRTKLGCSKLVNRWKQLVQSEEDIFKDWRKFEIFKRWATRNGWNENKDQILKRIDPNIGYFPGNIKIKNGRVNE